MAKKLAITIIILTVLIISFGIAHAQAPVPGVKGGDSFVYNITAHWSSSDPTATIPSTLLDYNHTLDYKFLVSSVDGSNVTATDVWEFNNGTQSQSFFIKQDIASGTVYGMNAFQTIVGGNLNPNDLLHPFGSDGLVINGTITRTYASGPRETNVLNMNYQDYNATYNSYRTENITYYFDKATGMLAESDDLISYTNPTINASIVWTLSSTNVWKVTATTANPTFPIVPVIIAAVIIIVVSLIGVILYRKRTSRNLRR
jgi:hypothetical protein